MDANADVVAAAPSFGDEQADGPGVLLDLLAAPAWMSSAKCRDHPEVDWLSGQEKNRRRAGTTGAGTGARTAGWRRSELVDPDAWLAAVADDFKPHQMLDKPYAGRGQSTVVAEQ